MSKKRGLSIDEKKQKVLEIFHESKDVFVLKDIEKLAPKKGVVLQSVKEVVQALVDDDLVHQDKIGASNFFWSFPSEAAVKLKTECKRREQELADLERQDTSLSAQIEESKTGKEDSVNTQQCTSSPAACLNLLLMLRQDRSASSESLPAALGCACAWLASSLLTALGRCGMHVMQEDRKARLEEMEQLQEALTKAQKEVAQYADSDPSRVEAMRVAAELAKSSANRWLDNTWALESWCKKRFQGMEETLGNFFRENGLTEDVDYIA